MKGKILFINFGHASTPVVSNLEVERINIPIQLNNPADPVELESVAVQAISNICPEIKRAFDSLEKEGIDYKIVIGIPGASAFALALLSVLHGLLGYFPLVVTGTKKESGGFIYDLDNTIDLNKIRNNARSLRSQLGL